MGFPDEQWHERQDIDKCEDAECNQMCLSVVVPTFIEFVIRVEVIAVLSTMLIYDDVIDRNGSCD